MTSLVFLFLSFSGIIAQEENSSTPSIKVSQPAQERKEIATTKNKVTLKDRFKYTWTDIGFTNFYPVPKTRLHDFAKRNYGAMLRFNFMVMNIKPLWLSMGLWVQSYISKTHRIDTLNDLGFNFGLGYRLWFPKSKKKGGGNSRWSFTPRFSIGYLLHITKGDYYDDYRIYPGDSRAGVIKTRFFHDSYFLIEPEFAVDVTPAKQKKIQAEIFLSPSVIMFPEKKRHGYELGYIAGFRLKKGVSNLNIYLSGKAVDQQTGKIISDIDVSLNGSAFGETKIQGEEQYAYQISKTENYTLKISAEGYEPTMMNITKQELELLNQKERKFITIPLTKKKVWGVYGNVFLQDSSTGISDVDIYLQKTSSTKDRKGSHITKAVLKNSTDSEGKFRVSLEKNTNYTFFFKKKGFFLIRGYFSTSGKEAGWYELDKYMKLTLQVAVQGKKIDFESIYYDSGKANIRPESMVVLDSMTEFFVDNPNVVVELSAHTDSIGNSDSNKMLSQKRAESAVNVLINNEVPRSHISPKGYGEEKIMNQCVDGVRCSKAEQQKTRRTEFRVKEILKDKKKK